jgi:acyl transferase domain-containing protein/acyl carrier protein
MSFVGKDYWLLAQRKLSIQQTHRGGNRSRVCCKDLLWSTDINRIAISEIQDLHNVIEKSTAPNQPKVDGLIKWLVRELSQILEISQEALATNEPFSYFGLDSAKAVDMMHRLSTLVGRKLPVALAWHYPTIGALATHLCDDTPSASKEFSYLITRPPWHQSIAVVGMACRFPEAPDPVAFWDLLGSGRAAFREISSDRWDINAWYDPDLGKPGRMNARKAGLLERIDEFDAGFFGISPREAVQMDPQQRLALELAWEALEDAGIKPGALRASRTGVFVGVVSRDYESIVRKDVAEITIHSGTGQSPSIIANRISYALGLQGPSMALDAACSSSLVSVHLACRSLQAGDATLALAGGVNMIISPDTMVVLSKFGGLSPTSELRAFDARANGFVRGEGGGFLVLKSLNRALADGDRIYAVIRGTAVNNDGASNGLTAPNPQAQENVLKEAWARANITTGNIHYVETHGTGTPLGDPIEAHALGRVFGHGRTDDNPLLIGSVKTNIGHLEGASGIAGLIKLVLAVHHRQIPPSLNFEIPNPHIDFTGSKLRVVTEFEPWPEPGKPALGGVSAFGWGGTNCHVVVEEADRSTPHLLPLSAPDLGILKGTAEKLLTYLNSASPEPALRDVCATAAVRCAVQPQRVALTARSVSELSAQLEGFLLGQTRPGLAVGSAKSPRPKLAFVFSPQGSQWLGMGKNLIAVEPLFRAKLAECDRTLTKIAGWSLLDELLAEPGDSRLARAEYVQPTLCAMQVALAELWLSWGVRPDFVAAHSLGEWAASCVVGALSVEETMRVAVESSRAQVRAGAGGGMAVVELAEAEVKQRIQMWPDEIFVAGCNSPTSTILSGDAARLKSIVTAWKEEGLSCSLIDVDVAAHSPRMDLVLGGLRDSLSGLRPTRAAIPFVSSVTGEYLHGTEMGPEHWVRHLHEPVLFTQVIERLRRDGCTIFLEISPHPLLSGAIQQTLTASGIDGLALSSSRRGDDTRRSLLNSLGTLYSLGWPVQWPSVTGGGRDDLSLPISAALNQVSSPTAAAAETPLLLPLSGRTAESLRDRARSVAQYIRTKPEVAAHDITYTAAARLEHFQHRLAVVASCREDLSSALEAFAENGDPVNLTAGRVRAKDAPKVAFVCSGQGAQWWAMGRELLTSIPVFRQEIARCADEMSRHVAWDLLEELRRDESSSRVGETEIAQPALFALQVALAAVWRSWGIKPDALVGHSVGEVAAAYLGGVSSFADAVKLICHRGRLMQRATGLGKMAAIELPEADLERLLGPYRDRVSIAAINSPASAVVSGEATAIDEIVAVAKNRGLRSKVLPVNYAFHSPQMEPFATEIVEAVAGLKGQTASVPVYSTVTGAQATEEDFDAIYWGRNIRQPVRFAAAVRAVLDAGVDTFVELSPHPVLSSMILLCAATTSQSVQLLPSLRQGLPEQFQMFKSLAALFATGAEIDWEGIHPKGGRVVALPTYSWQKQRYWLDQAPPLPTDRFPNRLEGHPLLGARLRSPALKDAVFQSELDAQHPAFLQDHQIYGQVILPATAYVEMALSGANQLFGEGAHRVDNLGLHEALRLDFNTRTSVQTVFQTQEEGLATFEIFSTSVEEQGVEGVWTRHVLGRVVEGPEIKNLGEDEPVDLQTIRDRCPGFVDTAAFYQISNEHGSEFGPAFQNVHAFWLGTTETLGEISLAKSLHPEVGRYGFHPALLDACFQSACFLAAAQVRPEADTISEDEVLIPVNIERVQILRVVPAALWSHSRLRGILDPNARTFTFDQIVYDPEGRAVAEIAGLQFKRVKRKTLDRTARAADQDWLFEIQWRELPRLEEARSERTDLLSRPGTWLVLTDKRGAGESLRTRLTSTGHRCILARPGPSFVRQGDDQFTLDPANWPDFGRLLDEAGITADAPLRGVLHLWSLDFPIFEDMTGEDLARSQLLGCGAALHLLQAVCSLKSNSPPAVWLVTRGAQPVPDSTPVHAAMASLFGLGQVIAAEHPELRCRRLDLDPGQTVDGGDVLFGELHRGDFSEEAIAFRSQTRLVPRLVRLPWQTDGETSPELVPEAVQLEASEIRTLENLQWVSMERSAPGQGEVEIQVQATGLNFRDVLCALGLYPGKTGALGAECAGVITRTGAGVEGLRPGDQVMAISKGGFSTYVTLPAGQVAYLPVGVSLVEAAAIPVAFLTTIYGLQHLARIEAGDRILIHAAAGGVGLAAVQLAQRAGAEIFATAGSPEKRSHLQAFGVTHVFDSRSLDFANEIMSRTGGRGVDIVLNSLAGEFITKSVSVLAPGGRFLELGKRGILTTEQFAEARPDCVYNAYDLGEEALRDPSLLSGMFRELLAALANGELRPLPLTTFSNTGIIDAFRFMAQAKHIGKIVVTKPGLEVVGGSSPTQFRLRDDATYLVTGGLGGLGLETARWMVREGARNIVLMGRRPPDPEAKAVVNELTEYGARIAIEKCDVSDEAELHETLNRILRSMPPLRGVIHAAGVLDDGMLEEQTWSRFAQVMAPKVLGAWNLHRLTRSSELDFFVLFSSVAVVIGSLGQGNYSAANAFMDGLAHHRKAKGMPALSIDWGVWAEAGMAARLADKNAERWTGLGFRPIRLDEGMAKLGEMLVNPRAQIVAAPIDWSRMSTSTFSNRSSSFFAEVIQSAGKAVSGSANAAEEDNFVRRLSSQPAWRRLAILKAHVESAASRALGTTGRASLDPQRPLHELGLDSLMSVELRNALATSLGRSLPTTLLFDYPTVELLTHYLAKNVLNLELTDRTISESPVTPDNKDLEELREMSESEAESLLLAELAQLKK